MIEFLVFIIPIILIVGLLVSMFFVRGGSKLRRWHIGLLCLIIATVWFIKFGLFLELLLFGRVGEVQNLDHATEAFTQVIEAKLPVNNFIYSRPENILKGSGYIYEISFDVLADRNFICDSLNYLINSVTAQLDTSLNLPQNITTYRVKAYTFPEEGGKDSIILEFDRHIIKTK